MKRTRFDAGNFARSRGRDFDRAHLSNQVQAHQRTANLWQYELNYDQNEPLKRYAAENLLYKNYCQSRNALVVCCRRGGAPPFSIRSPEIPAVVSDQSTLGNDQGLFVVGIGASAGGVQALERLFSAMPSDLAAAFVVVTHLGLHRETLLSEILGRHTSMRVMNRKCATCAFFPHTASYAIRRSRAWI